MGDRLLNAIGRDRCIGIKAEVEDGGLTALREASLYVSFGEGSVTAPANSVDKVRASEMLLIAIEAADDILIGFTNASYERGAPLNELFDKVSAA